MIATSTYDNESRGCLRAAPGYTLVELLVVIVIVSILASLTLAGLNNARIAAKRSVTETTIRKINEVVLSQYETYLSNRATTFVQEASTDAGRLIARRRLVALEMPERLTDIGCHAYSPTTHQRQILNNLPPPSNKETLQRLSPLATRYKNLLVSRYNTSQFDQLVANNNNDNAECLFLNVMLSGYGDPDIIMHFRDNEMGDTNSNGLREFVDAWGNPIKFLRWAPGFTSAFQPSPYSSRAADPFDLTFSDTDRFQPTGADSPTRIAVRLSPLIVSSGADGQLGLKVEPDPAYSTHDFDPFFAVRPAGTPYLNIGSLNVPVGNGMQSDLYGCINDSKEASDNIHSHSLSR